MATRGKTGASLREFPNHQELHKTDLPVSREYQIIVTMKPMSRIWKRMDNTATKSRFGHFKTERYDLKIYKTFWGVVDVLDPCITTNVLKKQHQSCPSKNEEQGR